MSDQTTPTPNATDLPARYTSLKERATAVAYAVQAAIPLTGRPQNVQVAFLLTYSDLQLLEKLLETAGATIPYLQPRENVKLPEGEIGEFIGELFDLADELVQLVQESFGVTPEAIKTAVTQDALRQLDLIESIVARAESNVALLAKPVDEDQTVPLLCSGDGPPNEPPLWRCGTTVPGADPMDLAARPDVQGIDIQRHETQRAQDEIFGTR